MNHVIIRVRKEVQTLQGLSSRRKQHRWPSSTTTHRKEKLKKDDRDMKENYDEKRENDSEEKGGHVNERRCVTRRETLLL